VRGDRHDAVLRAHLALARHIRADDDDERWQRMGDVARQLLKTLIVDLAIRDEITPQQAEALIAFYEIRGA
jgi:hypothetical protein